MGKTVSRCGGRVREFATCSKGLKKNERENISDRGTKTPSEASRKNKDSVKTVISDEVVKAANTSTDKEVLLGASVENTVTIAEMSDKGGMAEVPPVRGEPTQTLPGGDSPVSELERRQEAIHQRLKNLQNDVDQLSKDSGIPLAKLTSSQQTTTTTTGISSNQSGVIHDIVINADPDKPPLSLFIILKLLAQSQTVLTAAYVHSSVTNIDKKLKDIFLNGPKGMRTDYQFGVTLVWKKEERSPSMMVDPHRQSQIVGEANLVRYLARLFMPSYDSSDPQQATLIDQWLDIATHQLLNGNSKERAAAVRNLNSRLGNNDWLAASSLSLADIVVWSALHQSGQSQEAPANVKKWLKSCSNMPEFQLHEVLLH